MPSSSTVLRCFVLGLAADMNFGKRHEFTHCYFGLQGDCTAYVLL